MAETTETPDAAQASPASGSADSPQPAEKKNTLLIVVLTLVGLIAAGLGYAKYSAYQHEKHAQEAAEASKPEVMLEKQKEKRVKTTSPNFVKLEELTLNLPGGGGEHYLQVVIVVQSMDSGIESKIQKFIPQIRHKAHAILSARPMSELGAVETKNIIAQELTLAINAVIEPQLTNIFILQQNTDTYDIKSLQRVGLIPQATSAGEKLSSLAVDAVSRYWKVTEMDLPVQAVLFDKFTIQ